MVCGAPWAEVFNMKPSTTKNVTVEVTVDLAKCLWPLAWLVLILLS